MILLWRTAVGAASLVEIMLPPKILKGLCNLLCRKMQQVMWMMKMVCGSCFNIVQQLHRQLGEYGEYGGRSELQMPGKFANWPV